MDRRRGTNWSTWTALAVGTALDARMADRSSRRGDFFGQTVLATGAPRFLGLLIARLLAGQVARVATPARDRAALERASQGFPQRGQPVLAVVCGLSRQAEVAAHEAYGAGRRREQ